MLFDSQLLFFHSGTGEQLSSGEYVSLVGMTAGSASTVINLGNARDLGIGNGPDTPMVALAIGTGITSSCQSLLLNVQFQGSTNSVLWTTYAETGALSTASYQANYQPLPINVPRRPSGAGLPLYYRINIAQTGNAAAESVSTGSIIGGIVLGRADSPDTLGLYPSGFVVA